MKTCVANLVACSLLLTVAPSNSGVQKANGENLGTNSGEGLSEQELVSKMTLDTLVVRGKDWDWGNQDGGPGGLGTVVQAVKNGWVRVQWDSGVVNSYRMGEDNKYDLDLATQASLTVTTTPKNNPSTDTVTVEISEPQTGELFKVGSRVVRGRDWSWDDQDGGDGNVGEIVAIDNKDKWVTVKWDFLDKHQYRMGYDGKYDLKLAPEDITITTTPNDKPTNDSETIEFSEPELKDIFRIGSRVVRGRDWRWGGEDGGEGNVGEIVEIDSKQKILTVKWDSFGKHEYPINDKGRFYLELASEDLKTTPTEKSHPSNVAKATKIAGPELAELMIVGTRVVRGRDWDWGDQDDGVGGQGTVVRGIVDGWLKVEWDYGITYSYRMGYEDKYDLYLADSSSLSTSVSKGNSSNVTDTAVISGLENGELYKIGTRVVRGRDWKWDDQDGGEGNEGKIIAIDSIRKLVTVEWDLGGINKYRMGTKGKFDLTLAPDTTKSSTTNTPKRKLPEIVDEISDPESGELFKVGSRVVRGRDWVWDNQDGGEGNEGEIIAIYGKEKMVRVEWDLGVQDQYRMGYKGKYDLTLAPETNKRVTTISRIISTTSPITQISTSTTTVKVTPLKSLEPATHQSTSISTSDDVKESNKIFGLLIAKEIARVPPNNRLQIYQNILEVFKKLSR